MKTYPYLFTVFTPTFNRAHTLALVFESLCKQTFKEHQGIPVFEWLIVDDGSVDGTGLVVDQFRKTADFPIRYHYQENAGKHVAMNRGVALARGRFFLPADSDDAFLPETLDVFHKHWNRLSADQQRSCAGVTCLCRDGYSGKVIGDPRKIDPDTFVTDLPYVVRNRIYFERWGFTRTDILRQYPFPEITGMKFIPEGIVWNRIARRYKRINTREPLRIVYFRSDGFSRNIVSNYIRHGMGHYLYHLSNLVENGNLLRRYDPIRFGKEMIQLGRTGRHANIHALHTARDLGGGWSMTILWCVVLPLALMLARHDRNRMDSRKRRE
ncbi:MAG: glycosyltransferase family A protein [Thermodesulfobacteriota bacterium]